MPKQLTEHERQDFLAAPHIGVLSVASGSGRPPLATPIWYAYEPGGNLSVFTGTQGRTSRKMRLIQTAGVVSLTVQREEFPYKYVTVEGTVIHTDRPPSASQMLAVVRRYLPEEMAQGFVAMELARPDSTLILFTIRPDRWLTADFTDDAG
jgi:nitroimidazol reductase NimA-like FMN-containing flavoprotein (pyridoxamine 5'-phosphate oxidase superfamily)